MKKSKSTRTIAFLSALTLAMTGCIEASFPVNAEEINTASGANEGNPEEQIIEIRTAEDMAELSEKSVYDYYTKDKVFRLMNDIDLTGKELEPIAIFCGTLEGDNHVIKGFNLTSPGSDYGLFRFVEAGATVQNLTVEGDIMPAGTRMNIGGIAGTNRGNIINCHFKGAIVAKEAAGGIAGYNEQGALIVNCSNSADIMATKRCGGIAGYNEGGISGCINRGNLNATADKVGEDEEKELTLDLSLEGALVDDDKINFTGGITGISSGLIEDCANYGLIGYPHVGYHAGGIAGYQNGCIQQCHNYGNIRGRKDIGGIAGLFEPYVEVRYASDMINELRGEIDSLTDSMRGLSDIAGETNDRLIDDLDRMGDSTTALRDTTREQKDYYVEQNDQFSDEYNNARDRVEDRIDKLEFDVQGKDAIDALAAIRSDIKEMAELTAKLAVVRQIEDQLNGHPDMNEEIRAKLQETINKLGDRQSLENRVNELEEDVRKQADKIDDTVDDASDEASELKHNLKSLREETKALVHVIKNNKENLADDLEQTDDALRERADEIYDDVDQLKQGIRDNNDRLKSQMDAIERQMDIVSNTLEEGLDRFDSKSDDDEWLLFTDLSDSADEQNQPGLIAASRNSGEITADINGGGIAGAIAIEADMESEFEINKIGSRSLNDTGTQKATILNCVNDSDVTVKNDYAGGIAGRSDRGAAVNCKNYGNIENLNGNYTGGIMGKSGYVIRGCYALCNITGNDYAGGIAGLGTDLYGNHAMAGIISATGEKFGTIAGAAEGIVEDNYFVEEGIAAVDGLTYHSQASPVTYEELLEMDGTPEEYRSFHIKFMADDMVIKEINCQYGADIAASQIPAVPSRNGFYGIWEEEELSDVRRNITVHAIYGTWITTISSGGEKPVLLVSADFYPETVLTCETADLPENPVSGYEPKGAYRFQIYSDREETTYDNLRVRVLAPEAGRELCVAAEQGGKLHLLPTEADGSYLVFSMEKPGTFVILEKNRNITVIIIASGCVVLIVLLAALRRGHKKNRQGTGKRNRVKGGKRTGEESRQEA